MGLDPVVADPERVGLTGLKRRSADRHEHQQRRRIRLLVLLLPLALAGCDGEEPPSADRTAPPSREERLNERLSGTVRIATAPVTQPFATGVAANFEDETPVEVEVTEVDSRAALARLCAGEVAMAAVDLPVVREGAGPARAGAIAFPDELRRSCRRNGVEPLRVDLGFLVVAAVASSELGLDCMSLAELRRVWRAGSPVHRYELYGAAPGTAAFELFTREVIGRGDGIRAGWTQVEDAATIRERLAADDKALAFVNREVLYGLPDGVEPVAVDAGRGCRLPQVFDRPRRPLSPHHAAVPLHQPIRPRPAAGALTRPLHGRELLPGRLEHADDRRGGSGRGGALGAAVATRAHPGRLNAAAVG